MIAMRERRILRGLSSTPPAPAGQGPDVVAAVRAALSPAAAPPEPLTQLLAHLPPGWRGPAVVWILAVGLLARLGRPAEATAAVMGALILAATWWLWRQAADALRRRRARCP